MNKLIIVFCCFFSSLIQAAVDAQIDASEINPEDSFRLIIVENNPQNGRKVPDLTPLKKEFIILSTAQNMSYSIINGQSQSSSTWIVTLQALKSGSLIIPPIKVGTEETKPLSITVADYPHIQKKSLQDQIDPQQEEVMIQAEVNDKKPYINQQITYKVTLYTSKQLIDAQYKEPKVEDALLFPLGEPKRYQTQRYNTQYLVQEQNYAVFPQKSGPLKISAPVLIATTYDAQPRRVKATTKPITLKVQPVPPKYQSTPWLPAKQIKLTEHYEASEQPLHEGSTLIRTLTIEGVGIPAQLLPPLNFLETDAFGAYTEKGSDKNEIIQGELISKTEIKVIYLFKKSGKITLPELKLPWFDTQQKEEKLSSLPSKTLEVIPTSITKKSTKINKEKATKNQNKKATPQKIIKTSTASSNKLPWLICAFFALAWLITLLLWKKQKDRPNTKKSPNKTGLKEIQAACKERNPHNARDALLKWARIQWPDRLFLNLNDLTLILTDEEFKKQIQILSKALYKDPENNLWEGHELWLCIENFKKTNSNSKHKKENLPPMNPS